MIANFRLFPLFSRLRYYFGKNKIGVEVIHKPYVFPNWLSIPLLSPNLLLFPLAVVPNDSPEVARAAA
jgi:hypothetical protein